MATVYVNNKPVDIGNEKLNLIQAALNLERHPGAHCRTPAGDAPSAQGHGER